MPFDEVLLYDNPWYGESRRHAAAARRGRARRRRNPEAAARPLRFPGLEQFTMGVGIDEAIAAGIGLGIAGWIPRLMVPTADTLGQKWGRVLVGLLGALGAGFVANQIGQRRLAKAAVLGGLAGTAITAVNTLTPFRLGQTASPSKALQQAGVGRIELQSPVGTQTPGFEDIRLF